MALNAVTTRPEQSIPECEVPPVLCGVPRYDFAMEMTSSI